MRDEELTDDGRPRRKSKGKKKQKENQAALALKALLELNLQLYCDVIGTPCIRLPSARGSPEREEWPLHSGRVRAWVAEFIWDRLGIVLLEREIARILVVLEGKAWYDQRPDLDVKDAMDQDPLMEAIVIWVNHDSRFEGTHTKLLGELVKVGQKHGVDTQSKAWPKGAAQLSRRVNDLVPLLRKAGVVVTTGRKPGGERFVVLEHVHLCQNMPEGGDDAEHTSSQAASVDKSHHPKQMCQIDASDNDVFMRLKKQRELEKEGQTDVRH